MNIALVERFLIHRTLILFLLSCINVYEHYSSSPGPLRYKICSERAARVNRHQRYLSCLGYLLAPGDVQQNKVAFAIHGVQVLSINIFLVITWSAFIDFSEYFCISCTNSTIASTPLIQGSFFRNVRRGLINVEAMFCGNVVFSRTSRRTVLSLWICGYSTRSIC